MYDYFIVGSGIAGLTTAYYLQKNFADLTYKIIAKQGDYAFQMNGTPIKMRKVDPNAETEEIEFWGNGNMKSIKMYLGTKLKTEHLYDESGKRTKTLNYEGLKVTEKTY